MSVKLTSSFFWTLFSIFAILMLMYLMGPWKVQPAGDIIEYYGITESILNHGGISLTAEDKEILSNKLSPGYFEDPGYYIEGVNGQRYPVHFVFYSILAVPVRLLLNIMNLDTLKTLAITNALLLIATVFVISKYFITNTIPRLILLGLILTSPLMFFVTWPGPDLFYLCLLLIAVLSFYLKLYILSIILTAIASWHSQPLVVLTALQLYFLTLKETGVVSHLHIQNRDTWRLLIPNIPESLQNKTIIIWSLVAGILLLLPYLYNLILFGVFSPWVLFKDGWTELYGFGIKNIRFSKLYEQFFDLNYGLFWYAPFILTIGALGAFSIIKKRRDMAFLTVFFIITALFYHTNPAWHYGTVGYGPSRHAIFLLPLFLLFTLLEFKSIHWKTYIFFLMALGLLQGYSIGFNGYMVPDFTRTLYHSPYAEYMLDTYPHLYNPTPEIFVDRTNHEDLKYPSSAIYIHESFCRKAYILPADIDKLRDQCGFIPEVYKEAIEKLDKDKPYEGMYVTY